MLVSIKLKCRWKLNPDVGHSNSALVLVYVSRLRFVWVKLVLLAVCHCFVSYKTFNCLKNMFISSSEFSPALVVQSTLLASMMLTDCCSFAVWQLLCFFQTLATKNSFLFVFESVGLLKRCSCCSVPPFLNVMVLFVVILVYFMNVFIMWEPDQAELNQCAHYLVLYSTTWHPVWTGLDWDLFSLSYSPQVYQGTEDHTDRSCCTSAVHNTTQTDMLLCDNTSHHYTLHHPSSREGFKMGR